MLSRFTFRFSLLLRQRTSLVKHLLIAYLPVHWWDKVGNGGLSWAEVGICTMIYPTGSAGRQQSVISTLRVEIRLPIRELGDVCPPPAPTLSALVHAGNPFAHNVPPQAPKQH